MFRAASNSFSQRFSNRRHKYAAQSVSAAKPRGGHWRGVVLGCNRIGRTMNWVAADTGASNRSKHVGQTKGRWHVGAQGREKSREGRRCGEGRMGVGGWSAELVALGGLAPECPRTRVRRKRSKQGMIDSCGVRAHTLSDWRLKPAP